MNSATKCLVMVLFIGVVCANVSARKLEEVSKELMDQKLLPLPPLPVPLPLPVLPPLPMPLPLPLPLPLPEAVSASATKETKLGISVPKTATTKGIGTELDSVTGTTSAYNSEYSNANAAAGPGGPGASSSGSVYKSTYGTITAEGPNARATSDSVAYGATNSGAAAGPNGAVGDADAYGDVYSGVQGSTTPP